MFKIENWNGHEIRFVQDEGEWKGVIQDICLALNIKNVSQAAKKLKPNHKDICKVYTPGGEQEMLCATEFGIYKLIFRSNKPEAEQFEEWVYEVIRHLRQSTGLEGFQIFRMMTKEHQKEAMRKLSQSLRKPVRVNFIKANQITNKAVSSKFGHKKLIKKGQMTPEMLVEREPILEDVVELMGMVDRFELPIKVSQTIYNKYVQ